MAAIMNLTKGPLDVVFEPDRPAHETDAEDAIEITPEMIEIGADVILGVVGGADLGGFFLPQSWQRRSFGPWPFIVIQRNGSVSDKARESFGRFLTPVELG